MSTHELLVDSGDPDWSVKENVKERRHATHVPADAADGALKVTRNTGSLGSGSNTLSVAAGPVVVDGGRYDIASQSADIAQGDTRPRRDVVYVDSTGALDVLRGTPASPQWGDGVADTQQTIDNAYLPAPRSMASTSGVALAIITVPGSGATSLNSGSHVIEDIRPHERPWGDDLDEAFADGDFGYRRLSEFDTLQAALDYSDTESVAIYVDGQFVTNEETIETGNRTTLFGHRDKSAIASTRETNAPFIEYGRDGAVKMQWSGVRFYNDGAYKRFLVPHANFVSMLARTYLHDLAIRGFGGDTYTVHLQDAFSSTFSNLIVHNRYTQSNGSFRLGNCNACRFSSLKSNRDNTQDGETPPIYVQDCVASSLLSPHVEYCASDAAIQASGGRVSLVEPHVEGRDALNCGIQIGDGGLTAGHTGGSTDGAGVTIVSGALHGFTVSTPDNIRLLNGSLTFVSPDNGRINYGGSNHDAQTDLTVSPADLVILGEADGVDVVNNSGNSSPPVTTIDGGYANRVDSKITQNANDIESVGEAARIYLSADQSIPATTTTTTIAMDTASYDPQGLFDAANNAIDIARDGLYSLSLNVRHLSPNHGDPYQAYIQVNGNTAVKTQTRTGYVTAATNLALAAGDTVTFATRHGESSANDINGVEFETFGEAERLGSL